MADEFRTQDDALTSVISYCLTLPAAAWFRREFTDLLADMLREYNWIQIGTVTVEEAVQAAYLMYWSLTPMIGSIGAYATSALPANVLPCDGTYYQRVDYPALYAALDPVFIYDADWFFVPDLRGRVIVGVGTGTGLSPRAMGDMAGAETAAVSVAQMPSHAHTDTGHIHAVHSHLGALFAVPGVGAATVGIPAGESTSSGNAAISSTGGDEAHLNMQPFQALKYGIVAW